MKSYYLADAFPKMILYYVAFNELVNMWSSTRQFDYVLKCSVERSTSLLQILCENNNLNYFCNFLIRVHESLNSFCVAGMIKFAVFELNV